jgi:hypothetical protein
MLATGMAGAFFGLCPLVLVPCVICGLCSLIPLVVNSATALPHARPIRTSACVVEAYVFTGTTYADILIVVCISTMADMYNIVLTF